MSNLGHSETFSAKYDKTGQYLEEMHPPLIVMLKSGGSVSVSGSTFRGNKVVTSGGIGISVLDTGAASSVVFDSIIFGGIES